MNLTAEQVFAGLIVEEALLIINLLPEDTDRSDVWKEVDKLESLSFEQEDELPRMFIPTKELRTKKYAKQTRKCNYKLKKEVQRAYAKLKA